MEERYSRNRIYLHKKVQDNIKNFRISLAGPCFGSAIAECALQLGVENITVIDGDRVDHSNLNRQNYTENDIRNYKTDALKNCRPFS